MIDLKVYKKYSVNKSIPIPYYFQMKNLLLFMIENGELAEGDILPTEYQLCEIYNVSRSTIRQSLSELVDDGILYRIKGYGTFVAHIKQKHHLKETSGIIFGELPGVTETKLLESKIVTATVDQSTYLKVPLGTSLLAIKRVCSIGQTPIMYCHTYLPLSVGKGLLSHQTDEPFLKDYLDKDLLTRVVRVQHQLEALTPAKEDCDLLSITKNASLQVLKSIGYNKMGQPICFTLSKYRGDQNAFICEQIL